MGAENETPVRPARSNPKDRYFDPVRDKRMSELTPAQQADAYELWLVENLAAMSDYYRAHLAFVLDRVAGLRAELQQATAQLATVTHQGEFATWMENSDPELPFAAAKEWAEACRWAAQKLGLPDYVKAADSDRDPTHVFHQREDGLFHCKVCNGAEASLPTECPRLPMSSEQELAVQRGEVDFIGARWVSKGNTAAGDGGVRGPVTGEHTGTPMLAISYVLRDAMSVYPGSRQTPDYAVELAVWLADHDAKR